MFEFLRKIFAGAPGTDSSDQSRPRDDQQLPESAQRASNGLKHFFSVLPDKPRLDILDLGGLNQANLAALSEFGGTVHAVDLLGQYDEFIDARKGDPIDAAVARDFVDEFLNFPRNQFDAILGWDCLEFLDSDIVHMAVPRLAEVLRPGGVMLAFFHTQGRGETVPSCRYRIEAAGELALAPRDVRSLPNTFNNRSLERLFVEFDSIKFFLTRDSIREVIVSR